MVQLQAVVSLPVLERLPAVLRVLASQNPVVITSAALPPSTTVQVPVEEELPTTMVQLQAVADHFPSPQTMLHRSRFPPRHSPLRIYLRTVRPRTVHFPQPRPEEMRGVVIADTSVPVISRV